MLYVDIPTLTEIRALHARPRRRLRVDLSVHDAADPKCEGEPDRLREPQQSGVGAVGSGRLRQAPPGLAGG